MHYLNSERERESIKVSDEINLQYFNANTLTLTLFFQSSSDSKKFTNLDQFSVLLL